MYMTSCDFMQINQEQMQSFKKLDIMAKFLINAPQITERINTPGIDIILNKNTHLFSILQWSYKNSDLYLNFCLGFALTRY